jgi:hypothetical protein
MVLCVARRFPPPWTVEGFWTSSVGRGASAPHHLDVSAIAFSDSLARLPAGSLPTSIKNESTVTAESRQAISQRDREFAAALWFERRH